jgi:hypothetical protein
MYIIIATKRIMPVRQRSVKDSYTAIYESPENCLIADIRSQRDGRKNRRGHHIRYSF